MEAEASVKIALPEVCGEGSGNQSNYTSETIDRKVFVANCEVGHLLWEGPLRFDV